MKSYSRLFCHREGIDTRDAQSRSKLVGISRPHPGEINNGEAVQPGSRITVKGLTGIGWGFFCTWIVIVWAFFSSNSHSPRTCIQHFCPLLQNWIQSSKSSANANDFFLSTITCDRERYCASGALKGTKLYVSSRTCVRGVEKVQPPGQGSEKNKENLTTRRWGFSTYC